MYHCSLNLFRLACLGKTLQLFLTAAKSFPSFIWFYIRHIQLHYVKDLPECLCSYCIVDDVKTYWSELSWDIHEAFKFRALLIAKYIAPEKKHNYRPRMIHTKSKAPGRELMDELNSVVLKKTFHCEIQVF